MHCNLPTFWLRLAARRGAPSQAPCNPQTDLSLLETIDRRTNWPTHRIRCFLQTQVRHTDHRN